MSVKLVCQNKKAFYDYFIEEKFEAGMALTGSEVKSLRGGRVNLKDSYARVMGSEVFLLNTHISPYGQADGFQKIDPTRTRKLLLHKREIQKLIGRTLQKGYTLIPTKIYFKNGKAKVELAVAIGKKLYDKREAIKKREVKRELGKAIKGRRSK